MERPTARTEVRTQPWPRSATPHLALRPTPSRRSRTPCRVRRKAARSRGEGDAPLLHGRLLLANAGSSVLALVQSDHLIVLGHLHLSGGQFLAHMWAPALAALVVTAVVVGGVKHR